MLIQDPDKFFCRVAQCADAVVVDHFIGGDGSKGDTGQRTLKTRLPEAMAAINPASVEIAYRDEIVEVAKRYLPVGVNIEGFAERYLKV